jgi:hypothetical protein
LRPGIISSISSGIHRISPRATGFIEELLMEFANFVIIFATALILWRKPEKERLAFRLLVLSIFWMIALFTIATRTGILPGINY